MTNGKGTSRRPSPAKVPPDVQWSMRGGVAHGPRAPVKSGQCLLYVTKITQLSNVLGDFCGHGARSVDDTDHQTWKTSCRGECGWRELINFVSPSSVGLLFLSQFCSILLSSSPCESCLESCTTSTQTSQQTSTPQRVLLTDSGFKSKILHVNENCSTLNSSTKSQSFQLQEVSSLAHSDSIRRGRRTEQGFALLDTGASRTVGGYTMVQHVIDSLWHQQTLESSEAAVNFTFAGDEQDEGAASAARNRLRTVLCPRASERSASDLAWTRHDLWG